MTQPRLQDVCEQAVDEVAGVVGCAVVDLATGLPLALDAKADSLLSTTALELLAAAGVGYFGGDPAGAPGSGNAVNAVEEVQITTEDVYGFMSLLPGTEYELLVLVTERESTNLGLGWMALRKALEMVRNGQGNGTPNAVGDGQPTAADPAALQLPRRRKPEYANSRSLGRRAIWDHR